MVSIPQWDDELQTVESVLSGRLPKNSENPELVINELERRIGVLARAFTTVIRHQRRGPDWERFFTIRWDEADGNGLVTVTHDLGYTPDRHIVVRLDTGIVTFGNPNNHGDLRLREADNNTALMQISNAGITRQAIFTFVLFSSNFIAPTALGAPGDSGGGGGAMEGNQGAEWS